MTREYNEEKSSFFSEVEYCMNEPLHLKVNKVSQIKAKLIN